MSPKASPKFPVLSTKRLTLRAAAPKDIAAFHALLSIPEVTRFNNWPDAPDKTRVERSLRWMAKVHASGKGCAWIIEVSGSKALAGAIRFNSFEKKWRCGEIGYELHPDYWGKGLMTEAVRAVVACGHETFRLNRIDAWTLPGNGASDRVLEKSGFRHEGTLRQRGWFKGAFHDFRIFGRIAGDATSRTWQCTLVVAGSSGERVVSESRFSRRQVLAGAGGILMGQLTGTSPAVAFDWQPISRREAGFAEDIDARLDKAIADKRIWNLHSVVIVRQGRVVFERYFEGEDTARGSRPIGVVSFKPDSLHDLRSVSKSIVGLLYGIALAAGKVPAPEAPLMASFPEYADLAADPARNRWTLHHVLSMTMGTAWNESLSYTNPANSETAMDMAPDRYRYILDRPVVTEPGQRWVYNGGATALLGRLIARGTGKSLHEYAREVLFDPLGIGPTDWYADAKGELFAASGLRMTPRDLARIGLLMLRGGVWEGRSVIPVEWIARSTSPVVTIEEERQYGYQWYNMAITVETPAIPRSNQRLWNASGNGGQRLTVFPALDLVVVSTAGNYNTNDNGQLPRRVISDVVFPSLL